MVAPIKLPGKALQIIKYIALGLGVVETVLDDQEKKGAGEFPPLDSHVSKQEKEVHHETE